MRAEMGDGQELSLVPHTTSGVPREVRAVDSAPPARGPPHRARLSGVEIEGYAGIALPTHVVVSETPPPRQSPKVPSDVGVPPPGPLLSSADPERLGTRTALRPVPPAAGRDNDLATDAVPCPLLAGAHAVVVVGTAYPDVAGPPPHDDVNGVITPRYILDLRPLSPCFLEAPRSGRLVPPIQAADLTGDAVTLVGRTTDGVLEGAVRLLTAILNRPFLALAQDALETGFRSSR